MPDLYEITRKLVALGCGEHPRMKPDEGIGRAVWLGCAEVYSGVGTYIEADDARAIWESHAREWAAGRGVVVHYDGSWQVDCGSRIWRGPDLLAGIVEVLG